jgi:hypothetical protein
MQTTLDGAARRRAFRPEMAGRVGTARLRPGWDLATERRIDDGETLANGIGWFSLALGAAELAAPGRLAEWLGMEGSENLLRLYGLREVAKGVGILANRRPSGWMWARLAGDVLDLATLAPGLRAENPKRGNVALAMAAVAGVTVLDVLAARQLSGPRVRPGEEAAE